MEGVPDLLKPNTENKELQEMIKRDNLPNLKTNPNLVEKAVLKEKRNHISMTFVRHLFYHTHNIVIIKLRIMNTKNKKSQVYKDGSYIPHKEIHSINRLVTISLNKPEI